MLNFEDWGLIDYELAVERQLETLRSVADGAEDRIVFCSHPPVVTLGRSSQASDLRGWQGGVVETSRGGRATYHGPSQLVIYPILNLQRERRGELRSRDVHQYLRLFEAAIVNALHTWDVPAEVRTTTQVDEEGRKLQMTGVWVGSRKLASLGVAVKKWVTYHGAAINIEHDPQAFQGINPCGFAQGTMVSLQEILGVAPDRQKLKDQVRTQLQNVFE